MEALPVLAKHFEMMQQFYLSEAGAQHARGDAGKSATQTYLNNVLKTAEAEQGSKGSGMYIDAETVTSVFAMEAQKFEARAKAITGIENVLNRIVEVGEKIISPKGQDRAPEQNQR